HIADGRLQVAPLISHATPLEHAVRAFPELAERRVWSNKVLFAVSAKAQAEALDPAVVPALQPALAGASR
ncbi:MAG: galactitol-1-phosphate 5-dehydrogenase, partial [Nakamurella sp.]